MEHNFTNWTYQKWEENCEEREGFGEEHLSLDEYTSEFGKFLHDEYVKDKDKERNANL